MRSRPAAVAVLAVGIALAGCGSTVQVRGTAQTSSLGLDGTGLGAASAPPVSTDGSGSTPQQPGTSGARPGAAPGGTMVTSPEGTTSAPGAGQLPSVSGPGWDAHNIYVGFTSEEDLSTVLKGFAISFNPGSIQADVKAIAAHLNAHGGILGRKLVPVFRDHPSSESPETAAGATCAAFTQDRRVAAVVNAVAPAETPAFLECFRHKGTPLISTGYSTYDEKAYRQYGPYLVTNVVPSMTAFVPGFVPMLKSAGYLGGWDTLQAKPSRAPVVVGLLEPDTPAGHSAAQLQTTAFTKAGVKTTSFFYKEDVSSYSTDMQAAVLAFKQAGVTHITDITNTATGVLIFAQTANQQQYFPRYAMTSWLLPATAASVFAQGGLSKQLTGAVGVGWTPGGDVEDAKDPGATSAQAACNAIMIEAGIDYRASGNRTARYVSWALCDAVNLISRSMTTANGLSAAAVRDGISSSGRTFAPAATFASGIGATTSWVPSTFRTLLYDTGCTCFSYTGPRRTF